MAALVISPLNHLNMQRIWRVALSNPSVVKKLRQGKASDTSEGWAIARWRHVAADAAVLRQNIQAAALTCQQPATAVRHSSGIEHNKVDTAVNHTC